MRLPRDELMEQAAGLLPDAVTLRRRLHVHPELGLELPETKRAILESLRGLDLEIVESASTSGVVATLRGGAPGPTLLLRGDMDALPMPEDTDVEFKSQVAGAMHACGHDSHVAMLAGAARLLHSRRSELTGNVKFMFQPGEEGHHGARYMIEEGLLEDDPRVFSVLDHELRDPGFAAVAGDPQRVLAGNEAARHAVVLAGVDGQPIRPGCSNRPAGRQARQQRGGQEHPWGPGLHGGNSFFDKGQD